MKKKLGLIKTKVMHSKDVTFYVFRCKIIVLWMSGSHSKLNSNKSLKNPLYLQLQSLFIFGQNWQISGITFLCFF